MARVAPGPAALRWGPKPAPATVCCAHSSPLCISWWQVPAEPVPLHRELFWAPPSPLGSFSNITRPGVSAVASVSLEDPDCYRRDRGLTCKTMRPSENTSDFKRRKTLAGQRERKSGYLFKKEIRLVSGFSTVTLHTRMMRFSREEC